MKDKIFGLPVYTGDDVPEGFAALVNSNGDPYGLIEKRMMTKAEIEKRWPELYKKYYKLFS